MFSKIINKLKELLGINNKISKQEEINIFSNIKVGDIVWANRYENKEELEKIKEGHEIGPYIIIGFKNNNPIGIYGTSKSKKEYLQLGNIIGNKITYININNIKIITEDNYKSKLNSSLNTDILLKINKRLYGKGYIEYNNNYNIEHLNIETSNYEIGDIIFSKNYYLIIDIIDNKYIYSKIENYDFETNQIDFSKYKFNIITNITNEIYINTISKEQLRIIKNKYKEYLKLEKEKLNNKLDIGYIILYNSNYYYVSSINGNKYTLMLLKKANEKDKRTIEIYDMYFHPIFNNTIEIEKKEEYKILKIANESIREEMKKLKQNYKIQTKLTQKKQTKEAQQKKELNKLINKYKVGSIIENGSYFKVRFLVISQENDNLITINLDKYEENNIIIYYAFNIKDNTNKLIGTYNNINTFLNESNKVKKLTV